jgi:hypothetical protein
MLVIKCYAIVRKFVQHGKSKILVRELSDRGLRNSGQMTIGLMSETVRVMRRGDIRLLPATMLTGVRVSVQ